MAEYRNVQSYGTIRSHYAGMGYNIVELNYPELSDKMTILDTFANALKFPSNFGRNWDAFRDYIRDLSWLEIKRTAVLLQPIGEATANKTYSTLLDILDEASNYWKDRKVEFDVVIFKDL